MADPVILVDSYAQIHRVYHAVPGTFSSKGRPTNTIFGMANFLLKMAKDYPSKSGAFVFDKGRPAKRIELAPDYKANRPPMPEDLKSQLPAVRELIGLFGWNTIQHEGYEADDLLASIAETLKEKEFLIVSGDKDICQRISDRVNMLVPGFTGGFSLRGIAEVTEKFGVPPEQIADYLALVGDSADNIPGVPGVGAKTAASLLQQFGSGEALFQSLDKVAKPALRKKLEGSGDRFRLNMELVKLDLVPPEGVTWSMDMLKRNTPDWGGIREFCSGYGLNSIIKQLPEEELFSKTPVPETKEEKPEGSMSQPDLF